MKRTALFFGSFNPPHIGHMIIAQHVSSLPTVDELWMVISPQSPFKNKSSLANQYDRLEMVRLSIGDHAHIKPSDIEFRLPQPSYTIDTLTYLQEKYPNRAFDILMGGDNLVHFHKWKNYEKILENHQIYVYSRPGSEIKDLLDHPHVHSLEAPLLQISASYVRQCIADDIPIRYLVRDPVIAFIESKKLYKPKT